MLFAVIGHSCLADGRQFRRQSFTVSVRIGGVGNKGLLLQCAILRGLWHERQNHFPHACAIARRNFSRLRQSIKLVSRFVFIDKEHMTMIDLRQVNRLANLLG